MDPRNFQFLCFGLIAAWLLVAIYLVVLAQRGRKLRSELKRVRDMIAAAQEKPDRVVP